MVVLNEFYKNVQVICNREVPLGKRLISLLEEVIQRLPDEPQFKASVNSLFLFENRYGATEFWNKMGPKWGHAPTLARRNKDGEVVALRDGNCEFAFLENNSQLGVTYIITIVVDELDGRTDGYIKGLIVHELSEMSSMFRIVQKNFDELNKMKPKARQVMMNKLTKSTDDADSEEYQKHEEEVNNEARRLGFEKEIDALEDDLNG